MASETLLLVVPGVGLLGLTSEQLQTALSLGREALGQAEIAIPQVAPKGDTSSGLLDASGMAAATGVPASWFETAARTGRIPHHTFGRWIRFDYREVFEWSKTTDCKRLADIPAPAQLPPAKRLRKKS